MSEKTQRDYITAAIADNVLPGSAHRVAEIVSMVASDDPKKPIQFWQLYSVLGHAPIVAIAKKFYRRVFDDEEWFISVRHSPELAALITISEPNLRCGWM